jgi:HK97 family phage prohead protease
MAKTFIVSDESVNAYGFRVLTSGIKLKSFKANPIMLFNHSSYSWGADVYNGPIGRWENLKVEDGALKADSVFDVNDPKGKVIGDKVENDFLRAASIGFKILKVSEDPADMLPGQTRGTVTECELVEISVVDLPANKNALALYDQDNKLIELKDENDFLRVNLGGLNTKPTTEKSSDMKLKLTAMLTALSAFFGWNQEEGKELEVELSADQLKNLDTELARLKAENKTLTDSNATLSTSVTDLTTDRDVLKASNDKLTADIGKLNAQGRTIPLSGAGSEGGGEGEHKELSEFERIVGFSFEKSNLEVVK